MAMCRRFEYSDINNDMLSTGDDRTIIGNGAPKYTFGFINDVSYGNFT